MEVGRCKIWFSEADELVSNPTSLTYLIIRYSLSAVEAQESGVSGQLHTTNMISEQLVEGNATFEKDNVGISCSIRRCFRTVRASKRQQTHLPQNV